jgi:signal-transduction protein with cAMP-binding, CBS, and nucleotidyltransferase domain
MEDVREYHDEYSESIESDFRTLEGALVRDTVRLLAPSEPIKMREETSVLDAIVQMADKRRSSVVIVDAAGRMIGIFTERDLLRRVAVAGRDPRATRLAEVMTREPEALSPDDLIATPSIACTTRATGRSRWWTPSTGRSGS